MMKMNGNEKYKYVAPDDQYKNYDLSKRVIVDAEYVDTEVFAGNPYIEALPFPKLSTEEISVAYNSVPNLPTYAEFIKMPQHKKNLYLNQVSMIRIALPFHRDLEENFYRTLTESYSRRQEHRIKTTVEVEDETLDVTTGLCADHPGEAVNGFSMLGVTGAGKSTAIGLALDHVPQVIRHHFGNRTVIQIVYIVANCEGCSNFSALYQLIGREIDTALGNGNNYYEMAVKKEKTLGQKSLKVRELISTFNIGCLILDEIQNIDLTSTNENSIESILTINNDTHVGIGVLGTEEAFSAIFSRERVARRLSDYIGAGRYCENLTTCCKIITALFAFCTLFETPIVPDEEIFQAFIEETHGVISYIVELFSYIVKVYFSKKESPEINAEFIHYVAKTKMKVIHDIKRKQKGYASSNIKRNSLIKEMNNFNYDDEKRQEDEEFLEELSADGLHKLAIPASDNTSATKKPAKRRKKTNAVNKSINEMIDSIEKKD